MSNADRVGYPERHSFVLDGDGRIPSDARLWASDEISPEYSCYLATLYNDWGTLVYGPEPMWLKGRSPIELRSCTVSVDEYWEALCCWDDEQRRGDGSHGWTPHG
jgi:hypothetical protein